MRQTKYSLPRSPGVRGGAQTGATSLPEDREEMAMAVNNARYATAWPSDCACHPEGVAAWSAPKRAAGPVARNKDTILCRGLVIGVSCSGWRLRIALGNGNEAGRPSEDSVKRCGPAASPQGGPPCRWERVEGPGFEPGCPPRKSIHNNEHLSLGVVWKLTGRLIAQS